MFKKPQLLSEFVNICKSTGYFEAMITENQLKHIKFLSLAQILQNKIEHEWKFRGKSTERNLKIYNDTDFSDIDVNGSIFDKYLAIRKLSKARKVVPFGISEIATIDNRLHLHGRENKEIQIELTGSESMLSLSYFVNDKESREYFYRVQRERKIWWMKVGMPGLASYPTLIFNLSFLFVVCSKSWSFCHIRNDK